MSGVIHQFKAVNGEWVEIDKESFDTWAATDEAAGRCQRRRLCDYDAMTAERDQLKAEVERLRGIQPSWPPRPPEGYGLPRFGLRWNGPSNPLAVSMDDGYWTPWHLAAELRQDAERFRFVIDCPIRTMVALSRKAHEDDFDLGSECDQLMSKIASKKTGD